MKEKPKQAARTLNVVFVVASHYQSLQIVVFLLQACILGSLALSRALLLQQLQWLFEDRQCCKLLEGKVEMFSQFRGLSAGTGKLCILGNLGLVFIWSCCVSCLLFRLFYVSVSLRNLCSGTHRKNPIPLPLKRRFGDLFIF